jgi:hypothetical protein
MKVRLSALRTGRLLDTESTSGSECDKNYNNTIGNRTRDLPTVPQLTMPPAGTVNTNNSGMARSSSSTRHPVYAGNLRTSVSDSIEQLNITNSSAEVVCSE